MRVGVPRERAAEERRVALVPQTVEALLRSGLEVVVESGAGLAAGFEDDGYAAAGAEVVPGPEGASNADIVCRIGPPTPGEIERIPKGGLVVGFLAPGRDDGSVPALAARGLTGIAFELIPRTTLAQTMDALSSQATAAGYAAALLAAESSGRVFPMLTTAAGTVSPVRVLVIGAGVAGLQAIATSRRLGAVVSGHDVRPAAKEEIESLGARFVGSPPVEEAADASGYAREIADERRTAQLEALAPHVRAADVVICAALVPGRAAPLLVTEEMVEAMEHGSVIVDMAASEGGNCEVTRAGERVDHGGVIVLGPLDLPSRVAHDASQLYSRNVAALVDRLVREGALIPDLLADDVLGPACVAHEGKLAAPEREDG